MLIRCCGCNGEKVEARLTNGAEIYPHCSGLSNMPFWKCEKCKNHVGCHYETKNRTRPLGCIPTQEIRNARKKIHALLDPIWQNKIVDRKTLYKIISDKLGYGYHTGNIRSVEEARQVYRIILDIKKENTCLES